MAAPTTTMPVTDVNPLLRYKNIYNSQLLSFQSQYNDLVKNVKNSQYGFVKLGNTLSFTFVLEYPKFMNITKLPALRLDVNPETKSENRKHIITRTQTLGGWVEEFWGMELPVITCSGNSGAFLHPDYGITTINRRGSRSFQVFLALIRIMQENALVYNQFGQVIAKGKIRLVYDNKQYTGHFESFDFEENAENPFSINYNFTFKCEEDPFMQENIYASNSK